MIECSSILKDVEGKPWAVHPSGQQPVYFDYNPVDDNTKVYSSLPNDWERDYTYDMLGRRLTYTEGELAESYTYDGSNPATHSQSWFENGMPQSKTTTYHYNAHRLDSVSYDDALTTIYHYNAAGQPDSVYDESGVVCYEYGNMGEITKETRIYALPFLTSALALSTQFGYDSWGRIQNITYPDNEVVSYAYDLGGQLQSITNNGSYTYLDNVTYDRFGAKVSQTYGNGLVTNYSYNNLTRRLSTIATLDGNSQVSSFAYTYDNVGNVTQVASTCPWLNSQTFSETFTYDASDQLTAAEETQSRSYRLDVTYGDWGRVSDYALTRTDMQDNSSTSDAYSFTYPANPSGVQCSQTMFAPESQAGTSDVQFTFGINGSLRKREVTSPDNYTEYYLFNSAANLKAYSNNGLDFAYYGYNASNTRTYKLSFLNTNQWVNGQSQPLDLQLQNAMFYPNAYLNFNQNGEYTKHYYNGSERIASRLGNNTQMMDATSNDRLDCRVMRAEELMREGIQELVSEGQPVEFHSMPDPNALQPTGSTTDIFYYHTNHLGSTAFVTDQNQNVTQGFLYAPFGEITTEYAPLWQNGTLPKYSFNAKELDEETGMYYYEARYYKPPVFTSRDPMFEKYFWMTPYAYCANNPVKYVDPSGREIRIYYKEKKGIARLFEKTKSIVYTPGMEYIGGNSFVNNVVNSLNYVYNNNADVNGIISKSAETTTVVKIKKGKEDYFDSKSNTIVWSMKGAKVSDNSSGEEVKGRQSGALGLFHELGHFFQKNFHYEQFMEGKNTFDEQYGDMEEKRNIEQNETPAAIILGEGIRNNHLGLSYKTVNPISTKTKREVRKEKRQQQQQQQQL